MNNVFVLKLIEDTITSKHNKVMGALIDFEETHIRLCDYDFWISKKSRNFRLDITESPTNTQSTGKNSMWSQNYLSLATLTHH